MIAGLKPYPVMKDSGIPWLEEVPVHWQVLPLCAVATPKSITGQEHRELLSVYLNRGVIRFSEVEEKRTNVTSEDLSKYQVVDPGDFVLNNQQAWRGSVGVSRLSGIVSPAYIVLSLNTRLHTDFANHLFRDQSMVSQYLICSRGVGSIQRNLYWPHLKRVVFPLPSLPEQIAIVRFLEHADRRIRRYILAKQKLIALLEEQKKAIIHQAVTGQIDVRTGQPYPTYKSSSVEWLGDVPTHWKVQRIKQVAQVQRGKFTHRPRNDPTLYDGPYPFIQTGDVARAEEEITSYRQTLNEQGLAVSRMFPAGTLVMAIAANIGDVAVLGFDACFPDSVVGFVPCNDIERDFLYYIFRVMRPELLREAPVNTQGNLNEDRISSRVIAVAPTHEQKLIVQQIQADTFELNTAINRANREINLLYEYRSRLIADVVTGKLDVRDAAAALPEVDPLASEDTLNNTFNTNAQSDLDGLDATLEETEV